MTKGRLTVRRVAAAVTFAAALALTSCNDGKPVSYQGWMEAELIFVSPDEAGRIEIQSVREGDHTEVGAPLFTLDSDLQKADLQVQEAAVKNAQQSFDRAQALLKTSAGTQKALEDAEAALRTAQARLNSSATRLARRKMSSPVAGTVEELYFRAGEMVPAGKPVVSLLPPGNLKVRFFVSEAVLPQITIGQTVTITCDGCAGEHGAKVSFIARQAEFTPPVIYSLDERSKLVFLIEARPERPEGLRVGQPVSVALREPQR
jgi:HlyD family secretion protein